MAGLAPPVRRSGLRSGTVARAAAKLEEGKKPPVQAQLKVSSTNDPLEHEADRVADRVMRSTAPPPFPMAGPRREETAQRKTVPAEARLEGAAQGEAAPEKDKKQPEEARAPSSKPTGGEVKRAAKPDEKVKRATKPDEKLKRETKPDEKLTRQTKFRDDKVKRAAKSTDDKIKRNATLMETAQRSPAPEDSARPADEGGNTETPVQRDAAPAGDSAGAAGTAAPAGFENALGRVRQGGGAPLQEPARQFMEAGFGHSFDSVRVHSDGGAAGLADSIDARAFTLGNDLFFGAGQYQPHTGDGRRLIAHELTHVVQQNGDAAARRSIQRQSKPSAAIPPVTTKPPPQPPDDPTAPRGPPEFVGKTGAHIRLDAADGRIGTFSLPALKVPKVEGAPKGAKNHPVADLQGQPGADRNALLDGQAYDFLGGSERGSMSARRRWIGAAVADQTLKQNLTKLVPERFKASLTQENEPRYYLKGAGRAPFFIVGTAAQVATHELVVLPVWGKDGTPHDFDVDHLHELQLGGLDGWANFWVLDQSANRSSGSLIHSTLTKDVKALIDEAAASGFWKKRGGAPAAEEVLGSGKWKVHFDRIAELAIGGHKEIFWTKTEIRDGKQLVSLHDMNPKEIAKEGLRIRPGDKPTLINIFSTPQGGFFKKLKPAGKGWAPASAEKEFFRGFENVAVKIDTFDQVKDGEKVGTLTGDVFPKASIDRKVFNPPRIDLDLLQSTNLGFGLYVDRGPLNRRIAALLKEFKQASPVVIEDAGLSADGALFAEGRIQASVPLFRGVEIPFAIRGDELTVKFHLPAKGICLGSVEVTSAALEVGVGPSGLTLNGAVTFTAHRLGHGRLVAGAEIGGKHPPAGRGSGQAPAAGAAGEAEPGFSLAGSFELESDKIQPATIDVAYLNHQLVVDASLGLAKDAVRGIDSAQIHLHFDPTGLLIDGWAILGIASFAGVRLEVRRDQQGGIEISAENIPLPVAGVPGVRSATANIHVKQNPETGEWTLSGGGGADIDIAGAAGQLSVDINGAFITIAGRNITLRRGPLDGRGEFLVSNRPRDPEGNPIEGEPTDMTASGHLEASLPLGRYLKGTIGGTFLPNGEVHFIGGVQLPATVDLFKRKEFERVLFKPPPLDIPLLGVSAAGHRIGIFATIGGSLSFAAGIGPGQLRDASLTADFNPDRPEDTTVHGGATFAVPADAGLKLEVHGALGAGILIVSAEAGIKVGGELGIAAEASADLAVDWTPQQGLVVAAVAHLHAQPQFTFDIRAYVSVTLDLLLTDVDLYSNDWKLASYTFGPAIALGADLPIRWTEQNGLDFDINQINVQRPDIDIKALTTDLVHNLVG